MAHAAGRTRPGSLRHCATRHRVSMSSSPAARCRQARRITFQDCFRTHGRVHFWKVRMKPGMPLLFGTLERAQLPGIAGESRFGAGDLADARPGAARRPAGQGGAAPALACAHGRAISTSATRDANSCAAACCRASTASCRSRRIPPTVRIGSRPPRDSDVLIVLPEGRAPVSCRRRGRSAAVLSAAADNPVMNEAMAGIVHSIRSRRWSGCGTGRALSTCATTTSAHLGMAEGARGIDRATARIQPRAIICRIGRRRSC